MTFSRGQHVSQFRRMAGLLFVIPIIVAINGCGNGLGKVTGQVTLDGQPVHGGKDGDRVTIQFQPVDGVGANGIGLADENGNYRIGTGSQLGVRPGDYYVSCSVSTVNPNSPTADHKFANAKTSGLRCTVQPGKNEFNIPLQKASKTAPRTGA